MGHGRNSQGACCVESAINGQRTKARSAAQRLALPYPYACTCTHPCSHPHPSPLPRAGEGRKPTPIPKLSHLLAGGETTSPDSPKLPLPLVGEGGGEGKNQPRSPPNSLSRWRERAGVRVAKEKPRIQRGSKAGYRGWLYISQPPAPVLFSDEASAAVTPVCDPCARGAGPTD